MATLQQCLKQISVALEFLKLYIISLHTLHTYTLLMYVNSVLLYILYMNCDSLLNHFGVYKYYVYEQKMLKKLVNVSKSTD